jgi:hypothetical protein
VEGEEFINQLTYYQLLKQFASVLRDKKNKPASAMTARDRRE